MLDEYWNSRNISIKEKEVKLGDIELKGAKVKLQDSNYNAEAIYLYFDEDSYYRHFMGINPFDRCKLKKIVDEIKFLKVKPKALVLDFDLSPLNESLQKKSSDLSMPNYSLYKRFFAHYKTCEESLYRSISKLAEEGTLVVTVKNKNGNLKNNFESSNNTKKIRFASPNIIQQYGISYKYPICIKDNSNSSDSIGSLLFNELIINSQKSMCENQKKEKNKLKKDPFKLLYNEIKIEEINDLNYNLNQNSVIFIGSSINDTHDTILGIKVPGVMLHAIGYLSIIKYYEIERKIPNWLNKVILIFDQIFVKKFISFLFGYFCTNLLSFIFYKKINPYSFRLFNKFEEF
ncbi:MAG: hypothetical protein QW783_03600, partial [Candidatus Micrarchaeia archaeon]